MEVKMNRQSDKITAIYCRIDHPGSSEHIYSQQERALAYTELKHLENPAVFIDNGFTGTTFDRPQFQRIVREIKAGRVQAIVVTDLGRLMRSYLLFLDFVHHVLIPYGVALHSISDGLYIPQEDTYAKLVTALSETLGRGRD